MMATVSLESLGAFGLAQSANGSEPRGFSQLAVFRSAKLQVTVYIDNPCQLNPMKWVTREKAKVDRIACPWLIKKFVDKNPEFLFVPPETIPQVVKDTGAIAYDAKAVELTHYKENGEERVSFDAIIKKYKLTDPALLELAKIVRGADAKIPNPPPESAGLEAVAHGFRNLAKDDFDNMRIQFPTYDALYKYCQLKTEGVQKLEYNVAQPAR